jgi:hypothetical protein
MLYGVHELQGWSTAYQEKDGKYYLARPTWVSWGRWKHAWWVFTGRCDAIWWPQDGNPYMDEMVKASEDIGGYDL